MKSDRPSRSRTCRMFPAFLVLVSLSAPAAVAADDVYFVQRQISSMMSRGGPGGRSFGASRGAAKTPGAATNRLTRTDSAGGAPRALFDTDRTIVGFSVSLDGSHVLVHLQAVPAEQSHSVAPASQIVILDRNGTVEKTIDLAASGVRVYGSPVLLPDKKHIGLTVCKPLEPRDPQPRPTGPPKVTQRPTRPPTPDTRSNLEKLQQLDNTSDVARAFGGATYDDQPYVATVDLDGHNLKRIAPGAMPCWSPDGKTILFTAVTVAKPRAIPGSPRVSLMNADGTQPHPVAADGTWEGSFSRDGKKIVYVTVADRLNSQLMTASADGSGAAPLKLPPSSYASPRWLDDGKTIQFASRAEALNRPGIPSANYSGQDPIKTVWLAAADGTDLHRVSPQATPLASYGIDQDAELVLLHEAGPRSLNSTGTPSSPVQTLPPGSTVEETNSILYLREPSGRRTPLRNGTYQLPDGSLLHVRQGHRVPN